MARRGRGGYREPSSPAAVSGPGSLSQRTDGGPSAGSYKFQGLPYGDNSALNQQAGAAPMQASGGGGGQAAPGSATAVGRSPVFGPTDRPGEPITAGVDFGPGKGAPPPSTLPADPNLLLRALAEASGHPDLVRLALRGSEVAGAP